MMVTKQLSKIRYRNRRLSIDRRRCAQFVPLDNRLGKDRRRDEDRRAICRKVHYQQLEETSELPD